MKKQYDRKAVRANKHRRLRFTLRGTSERPRLAVFRSARHIYAQVIDDTKGVTLCCASTLDTKCEGNKTEVANQVGQAVAKKALEAVGLSHRLTHRPSQLSIKQVVFDRGGNIYHGRIKALAEGAREGGLEF